MTKNPRDEREWTNVDLQGDPEGYKAARCARKADQVKEREGAAYKDDLRRFTEAFVGAGGARKDAEGVFKARRTSRQPRPLEEPRRAHRRQPTSTVGKPL